MPRPFPHFLQLDAGAILPPNEIPDRHSHLTHGIVAASVLFIIESEAVVPGCYHALLGVLHLFMYLGIVTFVSGSQLL